MVKYRHILVYRLKVLFFQFRDPRPLFHLCSLPFTLNFDTPGNTIYEISDPETTVVFLS